jgi:hypothetical protein
MFRFGREGLDLHDCIKIMGNGHENYPIKKGEIAMYSYGEIDVRYLILKHCRKETGYESWSGGHFTEFRDVEEISKELIKNYIKKIRENEVRFECKSMVYFLIPPAFDTRGANLTTGTLEERKGLYNVFTELLYSECDKENIPVVSIYDEIIGDDRCTNPKFIESEGDIHLNVKFYTLIRDKIMSILCSKVW